ncbi:DUF2586 family protein [Hymenobacter rubripertinctus]|uniref:DUF2586 family protein n=1 Tax=Hymenobacter rubripertinctus TaxID=2029981 RepID=A0A418QMM4_9BACT|nr:DUF2586 family protein [Hymenobacter rubripertinctus]RIY06463.1 DUF2586 family protein [Hymenobacter rubripertinctus]
MNEFQGPVIGKPRGRLGRRTPSTDAIFGLVAGGLAVAGLLALGQTVKLIQPEDAVAVGINAAYDANNNVLVYHHVKRFFHYNPDGTLYLKLVGQGTTLTAMCDTGGAVQQLLLDEATNGEIKGVGVVLNPAAAPAAFTTGLHSDVLTAVAKAQALATTLLESAVFVDCILLEGVLGAAATPTTLPNLRLLASENVSVCIAADPAVLAVNGGAGYAEIGAALGMLSIRKVSECLGSVDVTRKPEASKGTDTYPLTDLAGGYFLSSALSNGRRFATLSGADKSALGASGYIYAGRFEGFDGTYFNDSHSCTEVSGDYAYIEDNRVWNKAAKLVRQALIPVMRGDVEIDPATGFLPASTITYYQTKAGKTVKDMATAGELSGEPVVTIEPNQDVVGAGEISLEVGYVRRGVLRRIRATVGAINPA